MRAGSRAIHRQAYTDGPGGAGRAPEIMSNTGMDIPEPIERRLVDLEIKAAYSDDLLEQLGAQLYRQQQVMDRLLHELRLLRERLPEAGHSAPRSLRDEIPPHY